MAASSGGSQLPPGRYDTVKRESADGCLLIRLHKIERT